VPTTIVQDGLSADVARAFGAALERLSAAGATIVDVPMAEFAQAAAVSPHGAFASYEAFAFHRQWLQDRADEYDRRVRMRFRVGEGLSEETYRELLQLRGQFIQSVNAAAAGYDALLFPTTPDTAPTIAEATKDDESYLRLNARMLRNAAIVNLFDGCALSIPCHEPGSAPVGLTIAGTQNRDRQVLAIGLALEAVVTR
jgi:aspartyl-tRNA(Asn)/glutamyl-tRNA(Gln) amidotransferase subunit A